MEQKVRIFEAFAGYGSQSLALERLHENFPKFNYEVVGISEIDKYAVQAYNAIHGNVKNWGDVTAIDWTLVPDFDLLTWSSPCQDISNAGKGKGMAEGSGTRSSLLWEVKKPIEAKRPKYILFENVKNFIGENNRADALRLFSMLEGYGYTVFYKVMNAKDYGVPQNRERIFILAIDGDDNYEFPQGFPLEKRLKDVLEDKVDERYYLKTSAIKKIMPDNKSYSENRCINVGNVNPSGKGINGSVYSTEGLVPTLTTNKGEGPKICQDSTICINSTINGKQPPVQDRIYDEEGCFTAITTAFRPNIAQPQALNPKRTAGDRTLCYYDTDFRIRKLTPKECFRLMDMDDKYIDTIQEAGISNSQQYKLAGNSIVVACLYYIFKNLFIGFYKTKLF